ncbi:MAG TPA: formamidopyrimidine-DNA glycosylase [Acidimicrobiaceae bacterium]|nr:formamidopyrimidine-DNA glycosylase [Acidimicrobiaceae bacterium]
MPELPEVEAYRRLADKALGRTVASVRIGDQRFLRGGTDACRLRRALVGKAFAAARRRGKLLVLDVDDSDRRLGLRFGMTGRLHVDGADGVDRLVYASDRRLEAWDRFALRFTDGGSLVVSDPRLLGGVVLDPDEDVLGPDALDVGRADLHRALAGSTAALKARLMDQSRLAGLGNLVADEVLWRAGLSPLRPAGSLTDAEERRLHGHVRRTLEELVSAGGSHLGELMPERQVGGRCPRCGAELRRDRVGGRSTWWCPAHQR